MKTSDLLTEKRLRHLEAMVSEIEVEALQGKIEASEIFKLIEVSRSEDFATGHIAGAVHIPLDSVIETASRNFRKIQQIVVYCEEASSSVGTNAVRFLQRLGFSNVVLLRGGKSAWREAGLPLDGENSENNHRPSEESNMAR